MRSYERTAIEQWMEQHDVSPHTNERFDDKQLRPNIMARKQIVQWCELHGQPAPTFPKPAPKQAAAGGGAAAAAAPLLRKPRATCPVHPNEQLRVFCRDCCRGVCLLCAVDTDMCKSHATKAFKPLIEELQADREGWERAQEECRRGAQQLCAAIQAAGDAKLQCR